MFWQRQEDALVSLVLQKLKSESLWAARWCLLAWMVLSAFLLLLLIGQVFSLRFAVIVAVPLAFVAALLHVVAMSELGGVYWRSRKARRSLPEYSDSALHARTGRGALLALLSQNCAFLALPLAQFALLAPGLWFPALGMSALSYCVARYAGTTSRLISRFGDSNRNIATIWL